MTIETTDESLVEQRGGGYQEPTTYTDAILEHQLPKEPSPLLNLLRLEVPSGSLAI